jgi:hypothetical protein
MADEEPAEVQDEDGFQEQGLKMNKEFQPEDDHGFPQVCWFDILTVDKNQQIKFN